MWMRGRCPLPLCPRRVPNVYRFHSAFDPLSSSSIPSSKVVASSLQQHPECIDNLLQNMMNAYENFAEIKEQILNITTRGAGGGGGGGGGDADD